jgi:hypothetical protein
VPPTPANVIKMAFLPTFAATLTLSRIRADAIPKTTEMHVKTIMGNTHTHTHTHTSITFSLIDHVHESHIGPTTSMEFKWTCVEESTVCTSQVAIQFFHLLHLQVVKNNNITTKTRTSQQTQ